MISTIRSITFNGLWHNNPALVQLLGLCPLLAISATAVNAIGLGIATTIVLMGSNLFASLFRHFIPSTIRLPVFVMIIAALVTTVELLMQAFAFELYLTLGIFIPLIVTNCAILARADSFACKNSPPKALLDGFVMGLGFTLVLFVLGCTRELVSSGRLFSDMHLMFGETAQLWTLTLFNDYQGMLLAALPPGAFIIMGFIIALKNGIDLFYQHRKTRTLKREHYEQTFASHHLR